LSEDYSDGILLVTIDSKGLASPVDLPHVVIPKRYVDHRGWFSETFHTRRLGELGIIRPFVQESQSYSRQAGTLRGLHGQRPPAAQAKLISVSRGRILDVAVDIRKGSPSFAKFVSIELSAEDGQQLYVPPGFAHGFLTLEDDVLVMYRVSEYYSPPDEIGICWNDPDIGVPWPVNDEQVIVSDKDRRLPRLKDFDTPFSYDGHPLEALTITKLG
jgi:dTDP-4-dehydrorhamnose 3,5-epimerase